MKNKSWLPMFTMLLAILMLTSCGSDRAASTSTEKIVPRELTISKNTDNRDRQECMPTIDYMDALMLGDIRYSSSYVVDVQDEPLPPELIGEQIAVVDYTLSDDACMDYIMRNGDATLVPTGTPIYKMRDYDTDFRVFAGGRIFEVSDNPKAKTLGDLYDIEGKVLRISRVSGNDGSHMWDFSPEDTKAFISDMLTLEYVGSKAIYTDNPPEYQTSLRIHLKDGTDMRIGYLPKANALMDGAYGTKRMLEIVTRRP